MLDEAELLETQALVTALKWLRLSHLTAVG
jgi:hypothetical protein